MLKYILIFTTLSLYPSAGLVYAQTPEQERIKELETENDRLRSELAQLRLELSQLKREYEQIRPQPSEKAAEPAEDAIGASEKPAQDDAAKEKREQKYRSCDEIYREIPKDLRPVKTGWDIAQRQVVLDWLKNNVAGKKFEARKKIESVAVGYDSINRIWEVTLSFEPEKMRFMSWDMEERVGTVMLKGDKEFAEDAKKRYQSGGTINLSGVITGIGWDALIFQKADENWHPTYIQLRIDEVQIR